MRLRLRSPERYSSHMPLLMRMLEVTQGNVLELGMGLFSTPLIHYSCIPRHRFVVSYESDPQWLQLFEGFKHDLHVMEQMDNWNDLEIDMDWGLAFVDQHPGERRKEDIKRLAYHARFIVIHDTNGRYEKYYHYSEIWPLFKYIYHFGTFQPQSSIVSNFEDPARRLICS